MGKRTERATKTKTKKKKVIVICLIIIIVLSLLTVGVLFVMNARFLKNTDATDEPANNSNSNNDVLTSEFITPKEISEKTANFLVCGIDYFEGSGRGKLTDVIMLVSLDIEKKSVSVLQIPRDSYVGDEYPTSKINAIYAQSKNGGIKGLADTVSQMFSVPIDHYITINMDGFIEIVDKIGGVEIDVPNRIDLEGTVINAGLQTLNGKQAEIFVRERKSYKNGDLGRIEMQKLFLNAFVSKTMGLSKAKIVSLAPTLISNITTDLNVSEALGYYNSIAGINAEALQVFTLPVSGGIYKGLSVLHINREETADILNQSFRPYSEPVLAEKLMILDFEDDPYLPPPEGEEDEEALYDEDFLSDMDGFIDNSDDEFIDEMIPNEEIPQEELQSSGEFININ